MGLADAELDLAINTGLRKGSQYGLTWDMVDWKNRMLDIPRTKNEEALCVPLNDAAVAALRAVHNRGDGRYRRFVGPQEFDDDERIRASGAEQAACGGVTVETNCHHNCHRRKWVGGDYLASCCAVTTLGA